MLFFLVLKSSAPFQVEASGHWQLRWFEISCLWKDTAAQFKDRTWLRIAHWARPWLRNLTKLNYVIIRATRHRVPGVVRVKSQFPTALFPIMAFFNSTKRRTRQNSVFRRLSVAPAQFSSLLSDMPATLRKKSVAIFHLARPNGEFCGVRIGDALLSMKHATNNETFSNCNAQTNDGRKDADIVLISASMQLFFLN